MKIRILLADDHQIVREGIRLILDLAEDIEVVGSADNGRAAVEQAGRLLPDVVVMDIAMPDLNGMEAARQIKARNPEIKVIGLSAYADRTYVLGILDTGAEGYVLKSAAGEELVHAIRAVAANGKYLSAEITGILVDNYVKRDAVTSNAAGQLLGAKEREVLQLLAEGKSSKEIAACQNISVATVDTHRKNIMQKLNIHTIAELTKYAIREGLTSLE